MAEGHHHIIPVRTLAIVFLVLIGLTVITVITSRLDLGILNVPLALTIAGFKAILVAVIFMALKYDNPVNALILSLGIVFAVIFLALTLADTELRGALGITEAGTTIMENELAEVTEEPADTPEPVVAFQGHEEVFQQYCVICHSLDGTPGVGPSLAGLGQRHLPDSIRQSIMEPDAVVVSGYPGAMMTATLNGLGFYTNVSEASIDSLIAWLAAQ